MAAWAVFLRFIHRNSGYLRQLAAVISAVSVAIATFGIPFPVHQPKDTSEPFPCIHCGCGCTNAAMCWRECCCYSTQEKLAWAKENGVIPPAFLIAEGANPPCCREDAPQQSCCSDSQEDELASELLKLKPCCRARALAARQTSLKTCCQKSSKKDTSVRLPGYIAIHALKCHGQSLTLSPLPPSINGHEMPLAGLLVYLGRFQWPSVSLYASPLLDLANPPPELSRV